jgi:hypothetical protein
MKLFKRKPKQEVKPAEIMGIFYSPKHDTTTLLMENSDYSGGLSTIEIKGKEIIEQATPTPEQPPIPRIKLPNIQPTPQQPILTPPTPPTSRDLLARAYLNTYQTPSNPITPPVIAEIVEPKPLPVVPSIQQLDITPPRPKQIDSTPATLDNRTAKQLQGLVSNDPMKPPTYLDK